MKKRAGGKKSKNWVWVILGIVIIGLIIAGYFIFFEGMEEKFEGDVEKITIGAETSLLTAAVWVAEEKGFFEDAGLDLTIEEFESGKASFNDMLNGGVDISTVAPTPVMFRSLERNDFSIIATFVSSQEDVKVIVRKDSGISKAEDLKGKTVGIVKGSTSEFFLSTFLIFRNLEYSDVLIKDFNPSDLPDRLNGGEVDAIVIWEPHAYNAMQLLGDNALRLPSSDVYDETFNFIVMKEFVEENPETIKRFLRAIDRSTEFIEKNKEKSQMIVAKRLNLDKEVMFLLWDDFNFEISLKQSLILTLEDEANWAIENNLTEVIEVPNYLNYICVDELRDIDEKKVTIIK
ncbi:ABC transporter substrate-binding protein [archaeon]|jgi:ABC-type nitrate/sulfonate/bicarbonate transport system substrate-binding protein|nr:ABC transporter substrate-binding protein [archaeon]